MINQIIVKYVSPYIYTPNWKYQTYVKDEQTIKQTIVLAQTISGCYGKKLLIVTCLKLAFLISISPYGISNDKNIFEDK